MTELIWNLGPRRILQRSVAQLGGQIDVQEVAAAAQDGERNAEDHGHARPSSPILDPYTFHNVFPDHNRSHPRFTWTSWSLHLDFAVAERVGGRRRTPPPSNSNSVRIRS